MEKPDILSRNSTHPKDRCFVLLGTWSRMGILARRIAVGQECPTYIPRLDNAPRRNTNERHTVQQSCPVRHFPELRHCVGFPRHLQCWERDSAEIRDVPGK